MTTWKDYPDTSTPITAAALNDLESRADLALSTANSATENLNATTENLTTRTSALEARPTVQAGMVHMSNIQANVLAYATITFPTPFAAAPSGVALIPITGDPSSVQMSVTSAASTTGVSIVVKSTTARASFDAYWVAVGAVS